MIGTVEALHADPVMDEGESTHPSLPDAPRPRVKRHRLALSLFAALALYAAAVVLLDTGVVQRMRPPSEARAQDPPRAPARTASPAWAQEWTARLAGIETAARMQDERVAELVAQLHALQARTDRGEEHGRETDGGVAQLAEEVQRLARAKADLQRRVTGAIRGMHPRRETPPVVVPPPEPPKPPFAVVSVDLWDGRPYVALTLAGATDFLGVGDALAGWQVRSIDLHARQAVFVDARGRAVTAEVQR